MTVKLIKNIAGEVARLVDVNGVPYLVQYDIETYRAYSMTRKMIEADPAFKAHTRRAMVPNPNVPRGQGREGWVIDRAGAIKLGNAFRCVNPGDSIRDKNEQLIKWLCHEVPAAMDAFAQELDQAKREAKDPGGEIRVTTPSGSFTIRVDDAAQVTIAVQRKNGGTGSLTMEEVLTQVGV